jgi:hypothetical protein
MRIVNNSDPKSKLSIPNTINKLIKFYEPVGMGIVNNSDPKQSSKIQYLTP